MELTVGGYPAVKYPGLNISMFHKIRGKFGHIAHPLNPELIDKIADRGWVIIDKLAEGGNSEVFTCKNNKIVAVILFTIDACINLEKELTIARNFPKIFTLVYDFFDADIPYSLDEIYIKDQKGQFLGRTIQVIEKLDMSLANYIKTFKTYGELMKFKIYAKNIIIGYLMELASKNIYYWDLKDDNIGVIVLDDSNVSIKLMDLPSIDISDEVFKTDYGGFDGFIKIYSNNFGSSWKLGF